jgi:hypothetical protein
VDWQGSAHKNSPRGKFEGSGAEEFLLFSFSFLKYSPQHNLLTIIKVRRFMKLKNKKNNERALHEIAEKTGLNFIFTIPGTLVFDFESNNTLSAGEVTKVANALRRHFQLTGVETNCEIHAEPAAEVQKSFETVKFGNGDIAIEDGHFEKKFAGAVKPIVEYEIWVRSDTAFKDNEERTARGRRAIKSLNNALNFG